MRALVKALATRMPGVARCARPSPVLASLIVLAAAGCASAGAGRGLRSPELNRAAASQVRRAIDSMVRAPEFRNAHWGVLIVNPQTGDTLYAHNADKLFMPASNQKILTGAVALARLGPDYRFRTVFAARRAPGDSVLEGDLLVIGGGDPSVSDQMRTDAMLPLREIADSLAARGVRRVSGGLARAGDAFPDAIYGFGWGWDDFDFAYSAGVDELLFNEGFSRIIVRGGALPGDSVSVRTAPARGFPAVRVTAVTAAPPPPPPQCSCPDDSVRVRVPGPRVRAAFDSLTGGVLLSGAVLAGDSAVVTVAHRDPATAYLAALREALVERGIAVQGGVAPAVADSGRLDTLFTVQSPPLREILAAMQKPSQNQIAEVLLKTLGREGTGSGTADSGRVVVERQLLAWGADSGSFAVRDGSGLSRHDYVSPRTIVRILDAMRRDTAFAVFYDALPIAGVDGTIRGRMRGTPAQGNLRAKTGFVDKARSLSGYVTTADGELLIFSLLANNWTVGVRSVERVQDAIGAMLAGTKLYRARR